MAKKSTQIVKRQAEDLARPMEPWEEELAREAKEAAAKEQAGLARINKKADEILIDSNTVPGNKLRLIIVDYIFTHTYFEKKYVEGQSGSPDCYAYGSQDSGLMPHEASRDKQHDQCDGCPHNAFRTAENGKGKRCPGGRKIAVILPTQDEEDLQKAEMRVLSANSGSLKNWANFIRSIGDISPTGHPSTVLTEIGTERLGGVFVWTFKAVELLDPALVKGAMSLKKKAHDALLQPWPDIEVEEKPVATKRKIKGQG